jgi:copper(I)-binding protein
MKKSALLFFVFGLFLVACSASAQPDAVQNGIEISGAKVLLPAGNAMNGMDATLAGFMTIKNTSSSADRLTGVSADFAEASLHETKMEGDVMKMQAVSGLDIPAGQMLELRSGSYHIMLMGLTRQLKVGDTVNLTLEFQNAGKISLQVKVTDQ